MIVREFTDCAGTLATTVKCYPPSPTVWVWVAFPWSGQEFQFTFQHTREVRDANGGWLAKWLKDCITGGAAQDFASDLCSICRRAWR
jgi:hypothetical protein